MAIRLSLGLIATDIAYDLLRLPLQLGRIRLLSLRIKRGVKVSVSAANAGAAKAAVAATAANNAERRESMVEVLLGF